MKKVANIKKIAAITGAYGGLGVELAKILAKNGYSLVLGGRNKIELTKFVDSLKSQTEVIGITMDVSNRSDCETFIDSAVNSFGKLDLLVNNAGIWKKSNLEQITELDLRQMFETNTFGPIYLMQLAVKVMKKQRSGHILNLGSTAAIDYVTGNVAYVASKAALIAFTGSMRNELRDTGITATVFSPGGFKTTIFKSNPEMYKTDFYKNAMEPKYVAEKVMAHIQNPTGEWHVVLRR